eukprot:9127841-Ditylum_brightwellii.AAC.1
MAAVLVSHHHFLFVRCPWCSAFSCHFVECCAFTTLAVLTAFPRCGGFGGFCCCSNGVSCSGKTPDCCT